MDDILLCPVCSNKLRNVNLPQHYLRFLDKKADFIERSCAKGYNHSLLFFTDETTKKVDWLKMSLSPTYSRFIEINYFLGKSRIICSRDERSDYLEIGKVLDPDFPSLQMLTEKVKLLLVFS
jgi:hypothetical protein